MEFDEDKAQKIIGSSILVGITYFDSSGEFESQTQFYGSVLSVSSEAGILLKLAGKRSGEEYNLPPDTSCIWKAEPGVYMLKSNNEEIEDPNYLCSWEVYRKRKT
ncbi:MAG: hypothetical protein COA45_02185 [Zetaproteobacteria bacterium]|nr:MAG: hypothetical protein COA45_02185 [Zetaproteobacteria bacterium]